MTTVDIVCATFNGARFLAEFLHSLDEQTHRGWRLWVRDDGSLDDTVKILAAAAARDARIRVVPSDGARLGSTGSFAALLSQLPDDSCHVMFADQDDVWLPRKIEAMLGVMSAAESETPGLPVLVHSDLTVVDAGLNVVHPSAWTLAGVSPQPTALRRIIAGNVVTGAATMINRPLRQLVGEIPREAVQHDWWCAIVAVAFGRIVALHEPTVLYRQHDANAVGARDARLNLATLPGAIVAGFMRSSEFRSGLRQTAAQARAFLERYGSRLGEADRRFLAEYASLPDQRFLRRKLGLLRLRAIAEQGLLRTLSVVVRG